MLAGTSAGATLLGGLSACGGSVNGGTTTPPVVQDPIWGTSGAATQIIASLQGITQSMFATRDFVVTQYGAVPCAVVAATNPYTGSASVASPGSNQTNAAASFDSRPAFLAAVQACNAAGGGRVVVPAGTWYCAGTTTRPPPAALQALDSGEKTRGASRTRRRRWSGSNRDSRPMPSPCTDWVAADGRRTVQRRTA
ncbi:hypothetical protein ACFFYR_38845 [Paraburkholderia dipogonis]|uniref:hypothetical protein n=1 Tax=Paraburkholderia dipogonis TaxID=1211383 RepID=UPI0035ECC167